MGTVVKDWYDLLRELEQHPEWREELRRLLLTEELLNLPEAFRRLQALVEKLAATVERLGQRVEELAEAQKHTDQKVAELAAAQRRTEETVAALSQRMDELAEAQKRTEEALAALSHRLDELAAAQHRTENRVEELANAVKALVGHVDTLRGWSLEYRFQRHAPAYLGPLLRRIHVLTPEELATLVEDAEDSGLLEAKEATSLLQADVVCNGRLQKDRDRKVWAVVEVSWVVGEEDIKRAAERAAALRKIVAEPVIPVAAGNHISDEVAAFAAMQRVYTLIGRTVTAPEEYRSGLNLLTS